MAQRIVGLDIGTSAIRAVELTVGDGSRPILEAFGQVGLNPGTVVDGEIRDQTRVVEALQRLWHEGGFSERRVNVGVAGLRAITREVDMPPLPPDELDDAVKFQAGPVIPFPLERTAMSAKVIAQYNDADGAPQIRVLVAAAHRDLIDSVVSNRSSRGLQPVGMDLDTAALARALYDPASRVALRQSCRWARASQWWWSIRAASSSSYAQSISEGRASARRSPARSTFRSPTPKRSSANSASRAFTTAGPSLPFRARWTNWWARSTIRYVSFLRSPVEERPREFRHRRGCQNAGFLPKLQQGIDTPVQPASPLSLVDTSRLPISPEQAAAINPTMAVPVGLALPDPGGKPFNLLPDEIAAKFAEKHARNVLAISIAVVVGAPRCAHGVAGPRRSRQREPGSDSTSQQNFINNVEIPKYDKQVALKTKVVAQQAALRPLVATETNWLIVLNQLAPISNDPCGPREPDAH